MGLISPAELDHMLDSLDAEPFIHADGSVDGRTVSGIFDAPSQQAGMFSDGPGTMTTAPQLAVSAAQAAGFERGDRLTRVADGTEYYVVSVQPDGAGLVIVVLSEDEGEE